MTGIFISYRHEDSSGHAGRLYDGLVPHFGRDAVFMDIDALEPGVPFVTRIEEALGTCDVALVVIGPNWVSKRLEQRSDFVRLEVGKALERPDVRVIPLLVGAAQMPPPDALPEPLRDLTQRQALEMTHARWGYDLSRLIAVIERAMAEPEPEPPRPEPAPPPPKQPEPAATPQVESRRAVPPRPGHRIRGWAVALLAGVVVAGVVIAILAGGGDDGSDRGGTGDTEDASISALREAVGNREDCNFMAGSEETASAFAECKPSSSAVSDGTYYALYPSKARVKEEFDRIVPAVARSTTALDPCTPGRWNLRAFWEHGSMACFKDEDGENIVWTDTRSGVQGSFIATTRQAALEEWVAVENAAPP